MAASFVLTGEQSEQTARLPSVAFALIFVMFLIWIPIPWLDLEGRLISAVIFLTTSIVIKKAGRLKSRRFTSSYRHSDTAVAEHMVEEQLKPAAVDFAVNGAGVRDAG